jgi:hypothetical protein
MADRGIPGNSPETPATPAAQVGPRGKDEVALDLMKFIATTTGYGRAALSSAGFSGKPLTKTPEEQAEALIELFERCRTVINKGGS